MRTYTRKEIAPGALLVGGRFEHHGKRATVREVVADDGNTLARLQDELTGGNEWIMVSGAVETEKPKRTKDIPAAPQRKDSSRDLYGDLPDPLSPRQRQLMSAQLLRQTEELGRRGGATTHELYLMVAETLSLWYCRGARLYSSDLHDDVMAEVKELKATIAALKSEIATLQTDTLELQTALQLATLRSE